MFHLDHDEFAELKLLVPGFPLLALTLALDSDAAPKLVGPLSFRTVCI